MAESGDEEPSDPNELKGLKKLWQWVRDLTYHATELRRLREENRQLRDRIDKIERILDRQSGHLENLDRVIQNHVKDEVRREIERWTRP